jgi:hypothetical protein
VRRRGNLWARLAALEGGTGADVFRFRLTDGRTAALPVDAVLDVVTSVTEFGAGPHGATMTRVAGTPEGADLARSLVALAETARGAS